MRKCEGNDSLLTDDDIVGEGFLPSELDDVINGNDRISLENGTLSDDYVGTGQVSDVMDLSDNDRALQLLIEATSMFKNALRAEALSIQLSAMKEVEELTGIPSTIVYYAYRHGVLQAHNMYIKEEIRRRQKGVPCTPDKVTSNDEAMTSD